MPRRKFKNLEKMRQKLAANLGIYLAYLFR